jgi:hypothetical protein
MTETVMHTNDNEDAGHEQSERLHLFEIFFATWGLPVTSLRQILPLQSVWQLNIKAAGPVLTR